MTDEDIIKVIKETIETLPYEFKRKLKDVSIFVKDFPEDISSKMILGLFRGVPLDKKSVFTFQLFPDTIVIYRGNIERVARTDEERKVLLKKVLLHEIGHYFGLSERDLRKLGY